LLYRSTMTTDIRNPLIVQSDHTVLVELASPRYSQARDAMAPFAELVKSPEHIHTYRITPLSIWNACAAGMSAAQIADTLTEYAKYPVPPHVLTEVRDFAGRYGRLKIVRHDSGLELITADTLLAEEIAHHRQLESLLARRKSERVFAVDPVNRGALKQELVKIGFPAEDEAGYTEGEALPLALRRETLQGRRFDLRHYQENTIAAFHAGGDARGGSGVVVLPCGAGKTIVGMGCMNALQMSTLILTTGVTAALQWRNELLDKTTLAEEQIGLYGGATKQIRPVTIATYQMLTYRGGGDEDFTHLHLFDDRNWGLIVYDEVHVIPAPVFRITASLQARRRLGLTATLVREDGREDDVFALIGPKKADVPWKVLERQGWIAKALCTEIRLPLPADEHLHYAMADKRAKFRIASENRAKIEMVRELLKRHPDESVLIIATYVEQLSGLAQELQIPVLTGSTSQKQRQAAFDDFRAGRIQVLAVSKIANFAIDLPDASVAIQISGAFGSRQEEAQRLGRILRPKPGENQAHFYTLVSRDTVEQDFALNRQLFLCEQGYAYAIREL